MKKSVALLFLLTACVSQPPTGSTGTSGKSASRTVSNVSGELSYDDRFPLDKSGTYPSYPLRSELGEVLQPNEKEDVAKSVKAVEDVIVKRLKDMQQKGRGDHSTSHGCYPAEVRIADQISEPALEQGIASRTRQGATYKALVRLSNAETPDSPDLRAASMGLALKVFLNSDTLNANDLQDFDFLLGSENPGLREQDFLSGIHKTFMAKDIHDYGEIFEKRVDPSVKDYLTIGAKHPEMLTQRFLEPISRGVDDAPIYLKKRFWSTIPYAWGNRAAKFSFIPCHPKPTEVPGAQAKELRYQQTLINSHLTHSNLCYKLVVQLRPTEIHPQLGGENQRLIDKNFPIENAKTFWPDAADKKNIARVGGKQIPIFSPFQEIATVTVARGTQTLPPEQCERTVFNPWNGLKEHQPLGSLGRARLSVYKKSKDVRYHIYKSK